MGTNLKYPCINIATLDKDETLWYLLRIVETNTESNAILLPANCDLRLASTPSNILTNSMDCRYRVFVQKSSYSSTISYGKALDTTLVFGPKFLPLVESASLSSTHEIQSPIFLLLSPIFDIFILILRALFAHQTYSLTS
nr:hypothetical transcript [Hymenolepis microstoma]